LRRQKFRLKSKQKNEVALQKLRHQNQNKFQHPDHGQANDLGDNFYTLKQEGRQSKSTDVRIHKLKVKTV
jgi:hypothetical protein